MKYINENIRAIRQKKHITQKVIADYLNIKQNYYSEIESGKKPLKYEVLSQIAKFFEIQIIDIITYPDKYVKHNDIYVIGKNQQELKIGEDDIKYVTSNSPESGTLQIVYELQSKIYQLTSDLEKLRREIKK